MTSSAAPVRGEQVIVRETDLPLVKVGDIGTVEFVEQRQEGVFIHVSISGIRQRFFWKGVDDGGVW